MRYIFLALLTVGLYSTAQAERFGHIIRKAAPRVMAASGTLTCTNIVSLKKQKNALYKDENVHGGRGRTFIDQDRQFKGKRKIRIAGTNGNIIDCFGLFTCDEPYGCRYYQTLCGSRLSNAKLAQRAQQNGGTTTAYIGDGKGKCFSFNTTLSRVGSVRK